MLTENISEKNDNFERYRERLSNFSGEFYGTAFETGIFNTDWESLYFAFTTGDKENIYYHSGYIDGDKISGISYSADRKFTSHWTGKKKSP